jgi:hypothetical protein
MIKMMILAPRRSGMSHAEFRRYVTETHGPLVKSVEEVASEIYRYYYNFPIVGAVDSLFGHPIAVHLDIVTEAWFESVEAQKKNMEHPRYMQIIRPDEHCFADGERAVMHYTREIRIIDGEHTPLKLFYFRRRRPGLDRQEFQKQWLKEFPDSLFQNPGIKNFFSGYIQNHVVGEAEHEDGGNPKYFDVIDEFFIDNLQRITDLKKQGVSLSACNDIESNLLDTTRTSAFITEMVKNIP